MNLLHEPEVDMQANFGRAFCKKTKQNGEWAKKKM